MSGIRIVAGGASLFAPAVTRRLIERFAGAVPTSPPPALGELTPRELEVLRLVARGLSNAEIAAELVVSEHTARSDQVEERTRRDRGRGFPAALDHEPPSSASGITTWADAHGKMERSTCCATHC